MRLTEYSTDLILFSRSSRFRVQAKGRPIRVLYAFDPLRRAVLLLGRDKTGDDRFYEVMVPKAEKLWREFRDPPGARRSS